MTDRDAHLGAFREIDIVDPNCKVADDLKLPACTIKELCIHQVGQHRDHSSTALNAAECLLPARRATPDQTSSSTWPSQIEYKAGHWWAGRCSGPGGSRTPKAFAAVLQLGAKDRWERWLRLSGAGDGLRTRYLDLGKVALYQVSYSRS